MNKIFNTEATNHLKSKIFLDPGGIPQTARYEEVKYPQFEKFTEKQLSFFWLPQEIDISTDKSDFHNLPPEQQHIFKSNLLRQTILDSVQQRGPNLTLLPICGLPEVEVWIETWAASEAIHSRSYTHIIRNIYPNPSEIFDQINDIKEILDCATDISKYYNNLYKWNIIKESKLLEIELNCTYNEYEHKKALWLCLNSINILEGLRFYVSFACSWNFSENKTMEGNAKIIKLICRDENLHLGSTQYMLRTLPNDDPDYIKIAAETNNEVIQMFVDVIQQEKEWAQYLFQHGSMIGLSEEILCQYVDYIASKRMRTLKLDIPFKYPTSDPLPWTKQWISGKDVQEAPQEVAVTSYLISDIKQDVDDDMLGNLEL